MRWKKIAMTTPSKRMRAIQLGAELLTCIQADDSSNREGKATLERRRA
ncbi:hypothetical protein [Roseateles puraquae]|nr:hypothetical protein [Roseateles puraquae]